MIHPLRTYRLDERLSLAALATRVGSTATTLWRVEQGINRPSVDLIRRLVIATKGSVTANELVWASPRKPDRHAP